MQNHLYSTIASGEFELSILSQESPVQYNFQLNEINITQLFITFSEETGLDFVEVSDLYNYSVCMCLAVTSCCGFRFIELVLTFKFKMYLNICLCMLLTRYCVTDFQRMYFLPL